MALMERVATLIRANLNDLIDRAEDPEKMLKQVMLDLQNQLLQVKTQVAMAIANQHVLAKKQKEHEARTAEWQRKAELAVAKGEDELAREALNRSLGSRAAAAGFEEQERDQAEQVENLKSALRQLDEKLRETAAKTELIIARRRRARAASKAAIDARDGSPNDLLDRVGSAVSYLESAGEIRGELAVQGLENRLATLEKRDRIEELLAEIKARVSPRLK